MVSSNDTFEMEKKIRKLVVVPEEVLVKILVRLSLRNIARCRSVRKEWKSIIDSKLFRDLYVSSSSSSSVSWSIMNIRNCTLAAEIVGHHGCERWGLTNSPGSLMRYNPETTVRKISLLSSTDGLVLLYTETSQGSPTYHVGNPLLQQWVQIPLPPHLSAFDVVRLQENRYFTDNGLVTKMEKGVVVGYKVVWISAKKPLSRELTFMSYSSETGLWKTEQVSCVRKLFSTRIKYSVPLNGILHWLDSCGSTFEAHYVVSYDLFGGGNDLSITTFPGIHTFKHTQRFNRTITTSAGFIVYCNVFDNGRTIRVWRLVNYADDNPNKAWVLSWRLNIESLPLVRVLGADYFPVVMHPSNSDIIYLWSKEKNGLVLLNLRTRKFTLHEEEEDDNKSMDGCIMTFSGCKEYMDYVFPIYVNDPCGVHNLYFSQYVLPRWLNPLPHLSS